MFAEEYIKLLQNYKLMCIIKVYFFLDELFFLINYRANIINKS